jgi:HSP20 family molecular chaperone IbpA
MKDEIEILAEVLGIAEEDIQLWSDDSLTINQWSPAAEKYDTDREYIFEEEEKDCYMEFIGKFEGLYLYKN